MPKAEKNVPAVASTKTRTKTPPLKLIESTANECDTDEVFFSKVLLNVLSTFGQTYSEYHLLQSLMSESLLEGPWFVELTELMEKTKKKENMPWGGITLMRQIIGRNDVLGIVRRILRANPHLKQKPRPRETSITLGNLLDLNELELLMLDAACRYVNMNYNIESLLDGMNMCFSSPAALIGGMFGKTTREGQKCLDGLLFHAGILSKDGTSPEGLWGLNSDLEDVFSNRHLKIEDIDNTMFPHMLKTDLDFTQDYGHLETEINRAIDIIEKNQVPEGGAKKAAANKKKKEPVNVMFWGVAGTGKTELAISIAKQRGWNLKVIGDVDPENPQENSRQNRITSLKLASKIFRNQPKTVLLFDEMEDLFKADVNAQFSKAFINRIIETADIPIIWTTNRIDLLGQPVLRRMVYNIQFKIPPEEARFKIWQKYSRDYKVKVDDEVLALVAKIYTVPPAVIKNAVHVTSTVVGKKKVTEEELLEIVGSLDTLVNYGEKRKIPSKEDGIDPNYDLSCIKSDTDMERFTQQVVNCADKGFALCMYGAPGTGKSHYGRYLAKQMGKEVVFKRASDLQSMWVGECEKNIAKAFAEAKKKKAVLIIDEGDSFLRDRTKARASWEISQVNEMLSQMEDHPEPFILTTNLMKDLDAASLRRFTFKLKFDYLDTAQARRLFKGYFGVEAPQAMDKNAMLTPGDFANVRKQVKILGTKDAEQIWQMLDEETKLKPGKRNSIGF